MTLVALQHELAAAGRAYQAKDLQKAEVLAMRVLAVQANEPQAAELMGHIRLDQRRFREAVDFFKAALAVAPDNAALMNLIGTAYASDKNLKAAIIYFQQAVQAAPEDALAWESLGKVAYQLRRWSHARAAFEHCYELDDANDEAASGLARLALMDGSIDRAIELASEVIKRNSNHVMSRQVLAEANLRQGSFEQALAGALAIVVMPQVMAKAKVLAYGVAADAADALGRYDAAFAHSTSMNNAVAEAYRRGYEKAQVRKGYEKLRAITELTPQIAQASKDWPKEPAIPPTIYYIGFMSTGMSAFTRIMLRHPQLVSGKNRRQVRTWEEIVWAKDAVQRVAALTVNDMRNLRTEFGETVLQAGIELRDGQMMFDQRPFYTRHLMTLAAILPESKFVFAHRDPRDVVLSCFQHRSSPNISMYEFLDLETAAHYYDASMEASARARDEFDIDLVELGYDQLWADPEGETRRVLNHFGLHWSKALLGEDGTLLGSAKKTPSIWRNYEAQLAPVMPLLDKWVTRFGYD